MANQQGQAFEDLRNTISECSRIVRSRWRLATVGLSIIGSIAFWYSQYLPREYAASSIFERRDDVVLQNLIQGNSPYGFDHLKTTMTLDMTGTRALAKAAVTTGLLPADTLVSDNALTDREQRALDKVLKKYKVRPSMRLIHSTSSLDTIQLRCEANDPAIARRFVVALRDNYIADTRERIREILSSTKDFFETEVKRLQQNVADATDILQQGFEEFPGLDVTDIVSVGTRMEAIRSQYNMAFQRKSELDAQIAAREQFLQAAPSYYRDEDLPQPTPTSAPAIAARPKVVDPALEESIAAVRRQIVQLKSAKRMTDEHPQVRSLYDQLQALASLRDAVQDLAPAPTAATDALPPVVVSLTAPNKVHSEWKAQQLRVDLELDALRREYAVATEALEKVEGRLQKFTTLYDQLVAKGDDLRKLREAQTDGEGELAVWQRHLSRLDRILTAESGERGTQFTLIEEPKDVGHPINPRVASIFVVCSGLGLAAAALIVALAELFDRSFRSVGQVSRLLGIPVLESIGVIPTPREKRKATVSRLIWTPTLVVLAAVLAASATLAYASLEMPGLHEQAMKSVNQVMDATGLAQHGSSENSAT